MSVDRPTWALAFGTASLVAVPLASAASALLQPGDPDDPNTKALIAAALLVVPVWTAAALLALLTVRTAPQRRRGLLRALGPATALATSGWLLVFAWPTAAATPVPETREQVFAAQRDPHLWAPGAWRMAAAAAVVAIVGLFLAWRPG